MIIQSKKVWLDDMFIKAQLEINKDKIIAVHPYDKYKADIDYGNNRIVPGFIDIHTHGAHGIDTWHAEKEDMIEWMKLLPSEGVTAVCPTIMTADEDILIKALTEISLCYNSNYLGSDIVGIHVEGSCIQHGSNDRKPVSKLIEYQNLSNNLIKIITIAAEKDSDYELIKYCANHEICPSLGHSNPSYEQACIAYANGAKGITHIFNGMQTLNPRKTSLINLAIRNKNIYCEIICDGKDVTLDIINTLFQLKKDHIIMVSDTFALKGLPYGSQINLMGNDMYVAEDKCVRMTKTNMYAGPCMKMNEQLKLLIEDAEVPWGAAIQSCTINPSKYLGISQSKGSLTIGHDADIVVLSDDYFVLETFCRGVKMNLVN